MEDGADWCVDGLTVAVMAKMAVRRKVVRCIMVLVPG